MEKTMKCIRMFGETEIKRVSDKEADKLVKKDKCEYVPKSEWKKQVRKIVEKVEEKIKKVAKMANTDEATAEMLVTSIENLKKEKKSKKKK